MMRRNITQAFLALVLVFYPIVSISAEKNNASLDSYAYQIIDNILLNQKIAFESGEVLKDRDKTKLFDREELVVTALSIPKLEGVELVNFEYVIEDVNVTKNNDNNFVINAYILRYLDWGKFKSGYGDEIELILKVVDSYDVMNIARSHDMLESHVELSKTSAELNFTSNEFLILEQDRRTSEALNNSTEFFDEFVEENWVSPTHHDGGFRTVIGPYTWSPNSAKEYALRWALGRNPSYPDMSSSDCTNFVSQALHEGGIGMFYNRNNEATGSWFIYSWGSECCGRSLTWINAWSLNDMLEDTNIIYSAKKTNAQSARIADLFFYDYKDSLQRKRADGKADHTAIVTGSNGYPIGSTHYQPLVSYHSNNRQDVLWSFFWANEGGEYWVQQINR